MKLGELLRRLPGATLTGSGEIEITGISHDSRRIHPGYVFAALPGEHLHGMEFLVEAIGAGAVAVLTDRSPMGGVNLPWISTPEPRPAAATASWALAGDPQEQLQMFAVTGTNGKSTTAHLISLLLQSANIPTAFVGTLGARFPDGSEAPCERTTPEASDLAPLLRRAVDAGAKAMAMEVSSHGLVQSRLAGLDFEVAVWTNLSRDHLDYHGDMESYFAAKNRLFTDHLKENGRRVLPVDDPWGARLLDEKRLGDISWGLDRGSISAKFVESDIEGTHFQLNLPDAELPVHLPLVGVHNLRNALAAAAAAYASGIGVTDIQRGLEATQPLCGRLERVETELACPVFVDYAHTPEGLRSVLQSLRRITNNKLIVVFGAGGDRDVGKRGPMGFAVGELADLSIVTSDNPRSEDPGTIAEAVAAGVRAAGAEPLVVLDRRRAIATALTGAGKHSIVLVAGKGHETFQTIGEEKISFVDQEVVREEARRVACI